MHGNNKTDDELRMCLDYGIGSIIIYNEEEIERVSKICLRERSKSKSDVENKYWNRCSYP